jgi:hypothetical protein
LIFGGLDRGLLEGDHLLSELLVTNYASIEPETELVQDRSCHIVNVQRPLKPVYFARIWIDKERGVPLRLEYYNQPGHLRSDRIGTVDSIKLHQLPGAGWIPTAGQRKLFFKDSTSA